MSKGKPTTSTAAAIVAARDDRIDRWSEEPSMKNGPARTIVDNNPEIAGRIPEPPAQLHGIASEAQSGLRRLAKEGIINEEGRCHGRHPDCDGNHRCNVKLWQASRKGFALVIEELSKLGLLPCGHAPFRNPRGVPGYTCTNDNCEAVYSRAEIEEVLDS